MEGYTGPQWQDSPADDTKGQMQSMAAVAKSLAGVSRTILDGRLLAVECAKFARPHARQMRQAVKSTVQLSRGPIGLHR
jgi:hypothetical protein